MSNLILSATQYTPAIELNAETGVFSIIGKSYPENTFEFYSPVMGWLKQYFQESPQPKTILNIEILYFNSSSSKLFFDMFDLFEEAFQNYTVEINWIYDVENESAQEAGEDFIEDFEWLPINLVPKN
jgi:hypothetical protein